MAATYSGTPPCDRPHQTPDAPMVRAQRIRKSFPNGTVALAGVDVECRRGELLVLVGPSGCGKTTLLRSIAGLEDPTSGRIEVGGRDVTHAAPQARGVAMVFQHYALYPDKTVRDNIEFPLRMARVSKTERRTRSDEIARLLQIDALLDRRPDQLSGGQKQRVGIGRALVRGPQVLLMDEPLSNLDAKLRVEMRAELRALQQALGTTTVYVTHDQTEALTLADRICVLREGLVEQLDRPEVVFGTPATPFVAAFLGGMNLVEGTLTGGVLRRADQYLATVPAGHRGNVQLGVRPEDLHLGVGTPNDLGATGRVILRELLGTSAQLHVAITDDVVLRALIPADQPVGEQVDLHARAADLHLFAADGGRRIGVAPPPPIETARALHGQGSGVDRSLLTSSAESRGPHRPLPSRGTT
ncbi:MAG: ABC transporter ATP-binding protein [Nitriliruptoraceae bacterium]